MGVALVLVAPVRHILPYDVACASMLAVAALVPWTSHAIDIGVAEQFNPETVYRSWLR